MSDKRGQGIEGHQVRYSEANSTIIMVPLEQYFDEMPLGQGTGFMWKVGPQ